MFPKIAFHTNLWGDDWDIVQWAGKEEEEIAYLREVFDSAMSTGFNFWMTDWTAYGKTEEILGMFLRTHGREDYYVSADFFPPFSDVSCELWRTPSVEAAGIMFAGSVRRLHTGFIDILWLDENYEAWLDKLIPYVKAERIGKIGVKTSWLETARKFREVLREEGLDGSAVWGCFLREPRLLEWCRDYSTEFFSDWSRKDYVQVCGLEAVKELAVKHNAKPGQIITAWSIAEGTIPVERADSLEAVSDAVKSADIKLTLDEVRTINEEAAKV